MEEEEGSWRRRRGAGGGELEEGSWRGAGGEEEGRRRGREDIKDVTPTRATPTLIPTAYYRSERSRTLGFDDSLGR